jgi:NADH:ubiquinone oxidoreductase subunit 2 (subunit N)
MIPLWVAATCAGLAGALLLPLEPRHGGAVSIGGRVLMLAPLVAQFAFLPASPGRVALAAGLVVALLSRRAHDAFHTECALKVLWVVGVALALSMAGCSLLVALTGTPAPAEQWGILGLDLDPRTLWRTALPLTLIAGLVLLGAAPFHFWPSDVLQGAFPALAPLAVVALQVAGAGWLQWRLDGIDACPAASLQAAGVLQAVSAVGLIAGAATLLVQRQPERRIGALAGLHGALMIAAFSAGERLSNQAISATPEAVSRWAAHLALAVTGAGILARFTPAATTQTQMAAVMYRRHPWTAAAGLFCVLSLAGAPGTPGSLLWFTVARDVVRSAPVWLTVALIGAWVAAFVSAVGYVRAAVGIRTGGPPPPVPVPLTARLALWVCGLPLAAELVGTLIRK